MQQRGRAVAEQLPFAVVMLVVVAGLVRIAQYYWREGTSLIGGALVLASLLRAVLPGDRVGLLAIRNRGVDVLSYGGFGLAILFVANSIEGGALD